MLRRASHGVSDEGILTDRSLNYIREQVVIHDADGNINANSKSEFEGRLKRCSSLEDGIDESKSMAKTKF